VYVLVILKEGSNVGAEQLYAAAHERSISSLIKRSAVLLGGAFAETFDDAYAAYILRCEGVEEAKRIAAEDPFAINDVTRPECVEWRLVGINPDVIEASAVVGPEDI
jgi:hypothetical protein